MGRLIYSAMASLDGYIEDESGDFGWAAPDAEVHAFINELERPIGTYLYGRRMYEIMSIWESDDFTAGEPPEVQDFAAIWRAADKVVYSRTLEGVASERTRIERDFDIEAVRELKAQTQRDIGIGGPELAAEAIRGGLVDEYYFFLAPIVVGGGKPALPAGVRVELELVEEQRFASGMVYLRYQART